MLCTLFICVLDMSALSRRVGVVTLVLSEIRLPSSHPSCIRVPRGSRGTCKVFFLYESVFWFCPPPPPPPPSPYFQFHPLPPVGTRIRLLGFLRDGGATMVIEGNNHRVFSCTLWGYIMRSSLTVRRRLGWGIFIADVHGSLGLDTLAVI